MSRNALPGGLPGRRNLRVTLILPFLCAFFPGTLSGEAFWYVSNAGGMVMEQVMKGLALRNPYALSIEALPEASIPPSLGSYFRSGYKAELQVLYHDGELQRRQYRFLDSMNRIRLVSAFLPPAEAASETGEDPEEAASETEESPEEAVIPEEESPIFIEIYDENGMLIEERRFGDGGSEDIIRYTYRNRVLLQTETYVKPPREASSEESLEEAALEESIHVDYYRYSRSQSLREVERVYPKVDPPNIEEISSSEIVDAGAATPDAESGGTATAETTESGAATPDARPGGTATAGTAESGAATQGARPGGTVTAETAESGAAAQGARPDGTATAESAASGGPAESGGEGSTEAAELSEAGEESDSAAIAEVPALRQNERIRFPHTILGIGANLDFVSPISSLESGQFQDAPLGESYAIGYTTDSRGRILTETWTDDEGNIIARLENNWSGGRLESIFWTSGESERRTEYGYNPQGDRIIERNYAQGVLERTVRLEGNQEIEELYLQGQPILRTIWENGRRVSEERIRRKPSAP